MDSTKKNRGDKPKSEMDFGMIDLGGADAGEEKPIADEPEQPLVAQTPAARPVQPAAPSVAKTSAAPVVEIPKTRPPSRYQPLTIELPPRPLIPPAVLKIILLVLLIAGILGGAIFGIIKWREHQVEKEMSEKQSLDQRSLDSLREKAIRTESVK